MNPKKEYQYIGKSEYNVNATAKATGRAKYCSDMQLPGMLYAKVKRSPYPHAGIVSIDTSQAEQLPQGVELTPASQFSALEKMRAMVVVPTPRVPLNR